MSSQFNLTQPLYGTTNTNLGGTSSNAFATGFNSQEAFQNAQLTNFQPPQKLDSAITVLQLTSLIPEWKGHFDIIEKMLQSQDQSIKNLDEVIAQLESNFSMFLGIHTLTKGMLNNITIYQIIFMKEVEEMLNHHHVQNSLTVRARRQCESALGNDPRKDGYYYHVPNNLSVDLSKKMTEMVRGLIDKINDVNEEVQTLSELDLMQVPNYIKSVVENNKNRIIKVSEKLTELLNEIDYRKNSTRMTDQPVTQKETAIVNGQVKTDENNSNKNGHELILGNPVKISAPASGNQSVLRQRFMDALGVKYKISKAAEMNDVKLQIQYLRKFNISYDDSHLVSLREKGFNIMEILVPMQQNQAMLAQGTRLTDLTGGITGTMGTYLPSGAGTGLFASGTGTGTSNLFGSTTGTTGLFGSTTGATTGSSNLFGGTTTGTGTSNLFGSTTGTTGTSNLFGGTTPGTTTGTSNIFGGTTTGTSNLFGSTTGTTTGTTNLFGGTTPGTTTGTSGLFGTTPTTTTGTGTSNLFGSTTGATGLFGSSTTTPSSQFGTTTTGFGASTFGAPTQTTTGSAFGTTATTGFGTTTGATTGSSNLFGGTTTGTGTSNLFGSTTGTTGTSNLFGGTTPGTTTGTSNIFGGTTTGTSNLFGGTNTGSINQFGATSTPGTANVFGGTTTGSTSLFGGGTTGSTNIFGAAKNTTNDSNIFGKGTSTSSGLFGATTKPKTAGTEITIYQPSTTFGGFNRTQK